MVRLCISHISDWNLLNNKPARGQDLTEYGLLVALIAIVVIAAVIFFGDELSIFWSEMADEVAGLLNP